MVETSAARGYRRGRLLTATHGRTYYAATRLLPKAERRAVFALYGFARIVDDMVDGPAVDGAVGARVDTLESALHATLAGRADDRSLRDIDTPTADVLASLADSVQRFDIPSTTFDAFLHSMRMDIPGDAAFRNRYRTWPELAEYTYGSAAVIGLQMLPLLGVPRPGTDISAGASRLGTAFQLTNFIRDVAEDLDRDRVYLPTDELAAFGVDEEHLRWCRTGGVTSAPLRRALAHLIAVNRDEYRLARPAIAMLPNRFRPAIAAAATVYAEILTEIERGGYRVMDRRATVGRGRRAALAAHAVLMRRAS